MKVDQNPFLAHTHMLELNNLKVLIRPNQAESAKWKNIIIGEMRTKLSKYRQDVPAKKVPEDSLKNSTLGGQEKNKGAKSAQTGLTGRTGSSGKNSRNNNEKERPSFKELLAKYEKK